MTYTVIFLKISPSSLLKELQENFLVFYSTPQVPNPWLFTEINLMENTLRPQAELPGMTAQSQPPWGPQAGFPGQPSLERKELPGWWQPARPRVASARVRHFPPYVYEFLLGDPSRHVQTTSPRSPGALSNLPTKLASSVPFSIQPSRTHPFKSVSSSLVVF